MNTQHDNHPFAPGGAEDRERENAKETIREDDFASEPPADYAPEYFDHDPAPTEDIAQDITPEPSPDNGTPTYLESLNPQQRIAAEQLDGPVLILAGAGTGKTRVLTSRLAHLIHSFRATPSEIFAVTFTNKAAGEMKERVAHLLGSQAVQGWWIGTFHALAARMLRRHAEFVGLTSQFTIIDTDDQIRLLKQLLEVANMDVKENPPKLAAAIIGGWKDKALTPDMITSDMAGNSFGRKLPMLYRQYQERLKTLNACDFGDLLMHVITILKAPENAHILEQYHKRFRYLMVDEYQDTNTAQYLWLRLLAQGSKNICCVGDDDQSIYGWRGAEVENILRFEKDFEDATLIRLEQNYRSTGHILKAAGAVINNNQNRHVKQLWSDKGDGEQVIVHNPWDGDSEAKWVGENIEQLQRKQTPLSEIAVLVRTGHQMRAFEERFITLGLPYRVIGGPRFYERLEIRDALAYLRFTALASNDLALERIINTPARGLGDKTITTLQDHARMHNITLHSAILDLCETDDLRPKQRQTLLSLMDDFKRWNSMIETTHHAELASLILEESGYLDKWKNDKSADAEGRVENLRELVSAMTEFESLDVFLEHIALVLENSDSKTQEKISIMTLHGAKGLEFDCVFLPGWEEGLFPSQRAMDENGVAALEEERRLAYVGITRAKKKCFISHASNRITFGQWNAALPSRFIEELPSEHIQMSSDTGLRHSGSTQQNAGDSYGRWNNNQFKPSSGGFASSRMQNIAQKIAATQTGNADGFISGKKVHHDKFGTGKIIFVDGHKLDIMFEKAGRKRVMDSFVTLLDDE